MSCQQASRFLTATNNNSNNIIISNNTNNNTNCKNLNNNNHSIIKGNRITRGVVQQEDPYVFTESVPTTPPILFNTQKTRSRLSDLTSATSIGKLQQQKLPLTETNGKITIKQIKTQASFLSSTITTTTFTASTNTCTTAPTSKNNVTQPLTATTVTANNNCNGKKHTNVCIVRPQLQTQQPLFQHHHHQNYVNSSSVYEGDLKSISPPPLYTPPTSSLWQTPLLLESTNSTSGNINPQVTNAVASKTPTTTTFQSQHIMGCVTPTIQTVGSTTTTLNPSLTTTAMAKVAPIIVTPFAPTSPIPSLPSAQSPNQCLPPSKFHNHTLAQHLQKVECLKKPKKSAEADMILGNENVKSITPPLKANSPLTLLSPTAVSLKAVDKEASLVKHSENEDLNEIPVNVIFRMAVAPQSNEKSSSNIQLVKPQTEIETQPQAAPPPATPATSTSSFNNIQLQTNVNKKLSIPASKTITTTKQLIKQQQQQFNTSSIVQQHNATKIETTTALNSQQEQTPKDVNNDDNDSKTLTTNSETSMKTNTPNKDSSTILTLKRKNTHISNKTRKLDSFPSTNLNLDLPYNWQMGCSTTKGAVAIVKMSQHNIDLDTSNLATVTGLPYCLQRYWLNTNDFCKTSSEFLLDNSLMNRSLDREERIAVNKQLLRRQAMQLLSTRSLQKLPLQVARRRLICVDRLLKKYQQNEQNKIEIPANVKRCCFIGCDAYTLEMASHCQQHIVHNSAQHVFLPCTAKFADNTQCRVPVFDITHDLPLCMEHARKRDAYNRFLYEQRPRKISTNPIIINESKISTTNTDAVGLSAIKAQHKQQQQQHIFQQLPPNNHSNGNKRPTLVNQQARKRKATVGLPGHPVGRPQKRVKKTVEKSVKTTTAVSVATNHQMPRLTSTSLKRKSSTTSLESIASNSQHSTTSSTSQQQSQQQYQRQQPQQQQHLYGVTSTLANTTTSSLPPPALAPLSSGLVGHGLPQHLFSFGHDNYHHQQHPKNQTSTQRCHQQHQIHPTNFINEKHSFSASSTTRTSSTATASTPTELKDLISQFSFITQRHAPAENTADVNLLNTNSNSNFTSSGMGSTSSLPTADDFLTQDMLSICENSSASSADTGLGGLSDPELMLGGPEDDIPLADTHLLEEHDLENVLNSLPEDAFKELFNTVHQDESDEIERAIELADKHLKTLQQTIGSELGDFLDFNDDMLMDNGHLCNGSAANTILDTSALFIGGEGGAPAVGSATVTVATNATQGGGGVIGTDIRGLVQT